VRDLTFLFPFFVVVTAGCIFIYALYIRYRRREMQHREQLTALEKGAALPELHDVEIGPRAYLLRGMIWLFSGIALSIFLFGISVTTRQPKSIEQRIREAKFVEQIGGTSEQIREAQNDTKPEEMLPVAFSLAGLVPAGVGLAYLIFYRLERTRTGE
jgi:uncharacterized protein DUF6249